MNVQLKSGYQTPREIRETERIRSVGLKQPHRKPIVSLDGDIIAKSDDPRLESALGRFCLRPSAMYPHGLGEHCYEAGVKYREIVRESRHAAGFDSCAGWMEGQSAYETPTNEQLRAKRDVAEKKERQSNEVLIATMPGLDRAMKRLCIDEFDPPYREWEKLVHGLSNLAIEYRIAKSFHDDELSA